MSYIQSAKYGARMRGRFAPSPTGLLHLGNARTALLAWLQARAAGGAFVLRVEDLDPDRRRPDLIPAILNDLRWLGLDWDEGPDVGGPHPPYLQSERSVLYAEALARLGGHVYECFCSRRDVALAAAAPHAGEEGPRYPGICRALMPAQAAARRAAGRRPALRFRVPEGPLPFTDLIHGPVALDGGGDFIVHRSDGVHAYQLAVVVDDAAMGISHVLRGDDLLGSTPRQILLYEALGLPVPAFAHVPLLLGPDGVRLAKRHGDTSLAGLRRRGARPEAIAGYLAHLSGLAPASARLQPRDLVAGFHLAGLPRTAALVHPADLERLTAS